MSDFLLSLAKNPQAKKLVKMAGLPIPMPQPLARAPGAYEERCLKECDVVIGGGGDLSDVLAHTLIVAGANPLVVGDEKALEAYKAPGEAYGRPAERIAPGDPRTDLRPQGMVFDATRISHPGELAQLYEFFHPWVRLLAKCAHIVVLGRPPEKAKTAAAAAARAGLDGFVRSLAKEIGRSGSTANLVYVDKAADARLPGVLRFLLSNRAAFITAQPLRVTNRVKVKAKGGWVRSLDGKVALVTGAARGIGQATAELLAAEGAHVVCLDRPADDGPLSQVARSVGGSVLLADVSDAEAPSRIARALADQHGGVDIVVHNAGVTRDKTLAKMKRETWDQAVDINLGAVVSITEALLEGPQRDGGSIICLSSIAGLAGNAGQTNYAASKSGIAGFVQTLAGRVAERGIAANAIAPGFIETRLTAAIPVPIREVARRLSALGQGGLPQDVGEAITFLATPGASGLSGNVLRVCGGAFVGA